MKNSPVTIYSKDDVTITRDYVRLGRDTIQLSGIRRVSCKVPLALEFATSAPYLIVVLAIVSAFDAGAPNFGGYPGDVPDLRG